MTVGLNTKTTITTTMKQLNLTILICFLFMGMANSQKISYDHIGKFGTHGMAWALVQKDGKFGFIDTDGEVVIPIEYAKPDKIKIEKY